MAAYGARLQILEAINFVENQFPKSSALCAQAPPSTSSCPPWRAAALVQNVSMPLPPPPGITADVYHNSVPFGPPPGLVRVYPPVPAPPRRITNEDVSLFSDFAQYLDTGIDEFGIPVTVDVCCLICQTSRLAVPDRVSALEPHGPLEDQSAEWMAVLPCGHFFGSDCLARWLQISDGQSDIHEGPYCPLCRLELRYGCGHYMPAREYLPWLNRMDLIPMTGPEGGSIPHSCQECLDADLRGTINMLSDILFPRYIPQGNFRLPGSEELLHEISIQFKSRILAFRSLREHWLRW
ncbi:hypothetical protein F5Y19DRAFT_492083 [Xylariaceae sp. FL1651]|nr:hypothetical protein F5Y19DRAFT_492083 [Xylariaceae sp. FL1651]